VIVEHTFVTTRPEPEAFATAGELMSLLKFSPAPDPSPASREWSRGRRDARQTGFMSNLPQRLRINFDRGRISVAGSVELRNKKQLEARDTMVAITVALEHLLAHGQSLATSAADVLAKQAWIARMDRRRKYVILGMVAIPSALLTAAIVAAILHSPVR
jgi:hypothetical protein